MDKLRIGILQNFYGHTYVIIREGKHYRGLIDYDGYAEEEIPQYLYDALIKFEVNREKDDTKKI